MQAAKLKLEMIIVLIVVMMDMIIGMTVVMMTGILLETGTKPKPLPVKSEPELVRTVV